MSDESRKFLRIGEVAERTTFSKPHIYTLIRQGKFPKPIKLSANTSAWLESEVNAWLEARVQARVLASEVA